MPAARLASFKVEVGAFADGRRKFKGRTRCDNTQAELSKPPVSMADRLELTGMMNLVARQRTDLRGGDFCDRNRRTVKGGELNGKTLAALVNMDDRAHVPRRESMLRQVRGQRYAIKFRNHTSKGYAVMKRGASSPVSTSQIERTSGWRPEGVFIPPSMT